MVCTERIGSLVDCRSVGRQTPEMSSQMLTSGPLQLIQFWEWESLSNQSGSSQWAIIGDNSVD